MLVLDRPRDAYKRGHLMRLRCSVVESKMVGAFGLSARLRHRAY